MPLVDVKVPAVGESVKEGMIHKWHKQAGDFVKVDDVLVELETDKATVEVVSESSGRLDILKKQGETVAIGDVIGRVDTDAKGASPGPEASRSVPPPPPQAAVKPAEPRRTAESLPQTLSPAVRKIVEERSLDPAAISGTGKDGRITKGDALTAGTSAPAAITTSQAAPKLAPVPAGDTPQPRSYSDRRERREPMTLLRRRIAERLVHSQQTTAMLTTFNECDMSAILKLRAQYKESFEKRYGIPLGFMTFFVKAAIEGLKLFPQLNGWVDGNEIVYHDYFDVGVAVSTERGLMVPVVRDAQLLSFSETERAIGAFAKKARDGKISLDDLSGGTFTVSNGGVFGSLMSTPILNPPQSGILGMHKTQERAVVVDGQVVVRPMMYLALSYDHRIVDGKEAVQFLVKVKEAIEDPARLLIGV